MNRFDTLPHIAARQCRRRQQYEATGDWPPGTLTQAFAASTVARPNQRWTFVGESRRTVMTLTELAAEVDAFARLLAATGNMTPDSVVAIALPNSAGAVTGFHGTLLAGACAFPLSMRENDASLGALLRRVEADHLVIATDDVVRGDWAQRYLANGDVQHVWLADDGGRITHLGASIEQTGTSPVPSSVDGIRLVTYTSGSTSEPKIVLHADAELLNESHSLARVFGHFGTMLVPAPVGHITGILHLLTLPLVRDGDIVAMDRWDAALAVDLCRELGAETLAGTSVYWQSMRDIDPQLGGVKGGIAGGGPVAPVIVEQLDRESGIQLVRSYGSTEHPTITQSHPIDPVERRALTDGRACSGVEVRLVDDLGVDVSVGQHGEIVTRGPDAMAGYLDPALDAEVYSDDGWFRTGDVGCLDAAGNITISDRIKDIIIRGGENISAKEVEDIIHRWPAIDDVAVVAVPDATYGERACAFVTSPGGNLALNDLRTHLAAEGLEKFKWPEHLEVLPDLPRTASGKVHKQSLRESWIGERAIEHGDHVGT